MRCSQCKDSGCYTEMTEHFGNMFPITNVCTCAAGIKERTYLELLRETGEIGGALISSLSLA